MDEALAAEAITKKTVRTGHGSSLSRAVLYSKNVLLVLRGQLTINPSQDKFFSPKRVLKHSDHSVAAPHGQDSEGRLWKSDGDSERGSVVQ